MSFRRLWHACDLLCYFRPHSAQSVDGVRLKSWNDRFQRREVLQFPQLLHTTANDINCNDNTWHQSDVTSWRRQESLTWAISIHFSIVLARSSAERVGRLSIVATTLCEHSHDAKRLKDRKWKKMATKACVPVRDVVELVNRGRHRRSSILFLVATRPNWPETLMRNNLLEELLQSRDQHQDK